MSWSTGAIGKAAAVRVKVAEEFARIATPAYNMDAAEKQVAAAAGATLEALLADQQPDSVVEVAASGSMSGGVSSPHTHTLNISVQTKWQFIE